MMLDSCFALTSESKIVLQMQTGDLVVLRSADTFALGGYLTGDMALMRLGVQVVPVSFQMRMAITLLAFIVL